MSCNSMFYKICRAQNLSWDARYRFTKWCRKVKISECRAVWLLAILHRVRIKLQLMPHTAVLVPILLLLLHIKLSQWRQHTTQLSEISPHPQNTNHSDSSTSLATQNRLLRVMEIKLKAQENRIKVTVTRANGTVVNLLALALKLMASDIRAISTRTYSKPPSITEEAAAVVTAVAVDRSPVNLSDMEKIPIQSILSATFKKVVAVLLPMWLAYRENFRNSFSIYKCRLLFF